MPSRKSCAKRGIEHKPWLKSFGVLRSLCKETAGINGIIEAEFDRIEPVADGALGEYEYGSDNREAESDMSVC